MTSTADGVPAEDGGASVLSELELSLLAALRRGIPVREFARMHNYSHDWAKWKSREIRRKLGVQTLREAMEMTDGDAGISRADFDKLAGVVQATQDAIADLAKAVTPGQRSDAQAQVQARELDEKEMAKRLGVSLDDVRKIREENDYQAFRKHQERLDKERADAAAAAAANENSEGDGKGDGDGGRLVDGLGGISNLLRTRGEA